MRTGRTTDERDEGFSLIELLVVILILGVLTAVVVFAVGGITDEGEDSACQAGARTLAVAVETYFARHGDSAIPATGTDAERYERTLVQDGLIRETSEYWDVAAEGYLLSIQPC